MKTHPKAWTLRASDPVAAAVEQHLLEMQVKGYGELVWEWRQDAALLGFGGVWGRGATWDLAFIRLASALIGHEGLGEVFLRHLRSTVTDTNQSSGVMMSLLGQP